MLFLQVKPFWSKNHMPDQVLRAMGGSRALSDFSDMSSIKTCLHVLRGSTLFLETSRTLQSIVGCLHFKMSKLHPVGHTTLDFVQRLHTAAVAVPVKTCKRPTLRVAGTMA